MSCFLAETVVRQEFLKAQDRQSFAGIGGRVLYLLSEVLWEPRSHLEPVVGIAVPRLPTLSWRVVPVIARPEN